MSQISVAKAHKRVRVLVAHQLHKAMCYEPSVLSVPVGNLNLMDISDVVLKGLLCDKFAVEGLKEILKSIGESEGWLTSEQAAKLAGFSRPYMTALLDSEEFSGQVQITNGGHRRVKKEAVDDWMKSRGLVTAKRPRRNLLLDSPIEFFDEPELTPQEKFEAFARLEKENEESQKYRPSMSRR